MEKLHLDKILTSAGSWGQFQTRVYVPLCCVIIFSVFQTSYIFVARDTKYRCKINQCENEPDKYYQEWLQNAVPFNEDTPSRCLHYQSQNNDTCFDFFKNETRTCHEFIFEKNQTTIVQDFGITCDENLWKLTLAGTINAGGELVCLPLTGFLSDRFGRKFTIIIGTFLGTIAGLLRSLSPSYYFYLSFEFLDTALGSGIYSGAFILALEIVDTKRRSTANTIICLAYALGQVILGVAAWLCPSWRILLRILYAPGFLITLSLWYVPESIRWLVSKNKFEEAWEVLNSTSKQNGVHLERTVLDELSQLSKTRTQSKKENVVPFTKVLKSKKLLLRIILCSYTWICCNFTYYGLNIHSVALSDDIYINFILINLIEVPAYFLAQVTMDRFGRKKTLSFSFILGGAACICVNLLRTEYWLVIVMFLCGKFFITISYTTLYILATEMFPTKSRHFIFAICSMCGRLGSMTAPQVPLLGRLFKSLPLIIFSVMAFTSGVLAYWFPETLNSELPDEIDEAVNIDEERL
ncbi:organic cation transporter protein-like [Tenebrio molitor]|uniref:organic cation transporter protein-like n=1 Tax=Tenebrio molitor TaxID=7067 RepID=UPI003624A62B